MVSLKRNGRGTIESIPTKTVPNNSRAGDDLSRTVEGFMPLYKSGSPYTITT